MRGLVTGAMAVGGCVAIAACGSAGAGAGRPGGAMGTGLSYFPSNSPVVATLQTDAGTSGRSLQSLQRQEPDLAVARAALFAELAKAGVDYNRDVKPLLGTPAVLGVAAPTLGSATPLLLAWQTHSQTALAHLISDVHGLTRTGTHDGATLYGLGHVAFAVDGPLLLVSQNAENLTAALDRHAAGDGFSADDYAADTTGLPTGAAVSVVGDLRAVLDTPATARARRVPWVNAISGYGVTLSETSHNISVRFRLATAAHSLTAGQLPMASGAGAPTLAGGTADPIAVGLRDPAQVWRFITATAQAVDPAAYRRLKTREQSASRRTGVDIESLLGSLSGDLQVSSTGHLTIGRITATAADATAWEKVLADPGTGSTSRALGGGFYRITEKDGTTLTGGVVGDRLLLGNGTAAQERAYGAAASTPSTGRGALAFHVAVGKLVALALRHSGESGNPLIGQFGAMLGDLTGSVQATPQALTGSASLAVTPRGS